VCTCAWCVRCIYEKRQTRPAQLERKLRFGWWLCGGLTTPTVPPAFATPARTLCQGTGHPASRRAPLIREPAGCTWPEDSNLLLVSPPQLRLRHLRPPCRYPPQCVPVIPPTEDRASSCRPPWRGNAGAVKGAIPRESWPKRTPGSSSLPCCLLPPARPRSSPITVDGGYPISPRGLPLEP